MEEPGIGRGGVGYRDTITATMKGSSVAIAISGGGKKTTVTQKAYSYDTAEYAAVGCQGRKDSPTDGRRYGRARVVRRLASCFIAPHMDVGNIVEHFKAAASAFRR